MQDSEIPDAEPQQLAVLPSRFDVSYIKFSQEQKN